MAAKTFEQFAKKEQVDKFPAFLASYKRCWNAATKAAEEKFTSTNKCSMPCLSCNAEILSKWWFFCPMCGMRLPDTAHRTVA